MNVTPLHPAPPAATSTSTGTGSNFTPERWLLLGRSGAWLAAAETWMQQHRQDDGPLGWRLRHGLVQLSTAETLADAFDSALHTRPPVVTVLAEPGAFGRADGWLDGTVTRHWPQLGTDAVQLRIGQVAAPFEVCTARLARADGAPAEFWLLSGRSLWPAIRLPQADAAFEADALQAFQAWAEAFAEQGEAAELDDIYGSASTYAARMASAWQDDEALPDQALPGSTAPTTVQAVPGRLSARLAGGRLGSMAFAAAAAGRATQAGTSIQGVFDDNMGIPGPTDRYHLRCQAPILPGREQGALTVQLDLAAERWQAHDRLVLEIQTDGHPVLLLRWSGLADLKPVQGMLKPLPQRVGLSESHRQAMVRGVELWLGAGDGG